MTSALRALCMWLGIAIAGASFAQAPAATPPAAPPAATPASAAASPAPAANPSTVANSSDNMEGLAAVYSDRLAGRKTANGEVFRQSKLTAAHPTLAFGTRVKVTNTKNDKSVEVRINDRGPTQKGRVIDLSSAAAAKIGVGKKAMAPVKLEVVGEAPVKKAAR